MDERPRQSSHAGVLRQDRTTDDVQKHSDVNSLTTEIQRESRATSRR